MTHYGTRELADAFRTVRKNTIQIAEDIPENKYGFRAAPDTRTIGETLTHIALGPGFQQHIHGNRIDDLKTVNFPELFQKFSAEEAKPRSKAEIIALLSTNGEDFALFVETLSESVLTEEVAMGPFGDKPSKSRFEMLLSAKEHEMHHRGQLMVLQRMIGVVPHLTRKAQERMAQVQAGAPQAG